MAAGGTAGSSSAPPPGHRRGIRSGAAVGQAVTGSGGPQLTGRGALPGESWLTAAIPMDNPYCSSKLTRVRSHCSLAALDEQYEVRACCLLHAASHTACAAAAAVVTSPSTRRAGQPGVSARSLRPKPRVVRRSDDMMCDNHVCVCVPSSLLFCKNNNTPVHPPACSFSYMIIREVRSA